MNCRSLRWFFPLILAVAFGLAVTTIGEAKAPPYMNVDSIRAATDALAKKRFERVDPRAFDLFVNGLLMEYSGDVLAASQLYQQALDYFRSEERRVGKECRL